MNKFKYSRKEIAKYARLAEWSPSKVEELLLATKEPEDKCRQCEHPQEKGIHSCDELMSKMYSTKPESDKKNEDLEIKSPYWYKLSDGKWHHIPCFDGKIFFDGKLVFEPLVPSTIDEIRIFNGKMSEEQTKKLFYGNWHRVIDIHGETKPESDKESKCPACKNPTVGYLHTCWMWPSSQEELEVEELKLFFDDRDDCYHINNMIHHDSRIDILAEKINELIKAHNALVKEVRAK